MKDKLILFDWGNIVDSHKIGYTCYDAFDDLFRECGYRGNEKVFDLLGKYNVSCIKSIEEFKNTYELMSKDLNFNKTYDEFIDIYKKIFAIVDYHRNVAEYEVSLKDRCYIGIFSNLTVFDKDRLDKQVNLSMFDYAFLSFEMGVKKPSIEAFEMVNNSLPVNPQNVLLIDDREENINMAIKLGWNAIQANGLELDKIINCCEEFLNK